MSHAEHAARLLERVDRAEQSTRRITSYGCEEISSSSSSSSQDPSDLSLPSLVDGSSATASTEQTNYKIQYLQVQRAFISSQEAASMRYEKLEQKMNEVKSIQENDNIVIQKLEITVKQLTMEVTDAHDEADKQIREKRGLIQERSRLSKELELALKEKEEMKSRVKILMHKNNALKKKCNLGRKQKQIQLQLEYVNQNEDEDPTMANSDTFWV